MPRWPAGLHLQSGVQTSRRSMVQPRVRATGQHQYWRRVQVPLHASAVFQGPSNFFYGPFDASFPLTASTGPAGIGESWAVDMVQVQSGTQYGQPPLVIQQVNAQVQGDTTAPPPPIVAQVWLQAGGVNVHLLGQTTTGGNDNLDVGGVILTPGERLAVTWYNVVGVSGPHISLWFVARGTKTTLTAQG